MANENQKDQTESCIVIYKRCGWVVFRPNKMTKELGKACLRG